MRTSVMDMTDPEQVEQIEIAYYLLYSDDLQCVEQQKTPARTMLTDPNTIVVAAWEGGEIVGVCLVRDDYVLYPVMKDNYTETLTELIWGAFRANNRYLRAYTTNELILDSAVGMRIGVTRDGNHLEFK